MMVVVVTGSRDWMWPTIIENRLRQLEGPVTLIHGDYGNADKLADHFAGELGFNVKRFPITQLEWRALRKAAGPVRNRRMLDENPALVLAFRRNGRDSRGTTDCIDEARRRGIPTEVFDL